MRARRIMKAAMVAALTGMTLFALGSPALASTGMNGPSPPQVGDPVTSYAEIQIVSITNSTGGTFTLTCAVGTTGAIAYNSAASDVTSALSVAGCAGSPTAAARTVSPPNNGGPWKIAWASSAGDVPALTGSGAGLVPAGSVTVTAVQNGQASVTGQLAPHSGYSSTTDYCLQCHSVHNGGAYSLLASSSVTGVCQTCHSLFGTAANGRIVPNNGSGFPGTSPGTASLRSAYDLTAPGSGHGIGSLTIPYSTVGTLTETGWVYGSLATDLNGKGSAWASNTAAGPGTSSAGAGGLYCGSCHTPHGEFGQLVNTRWYRADVPTGSINEVQTVTVGGQTAGNTWTLTYKTPGGVSTASGTLTTTATASDVATALGAIVGGANVGVTGGPAPGTFTVTFQAALGGMNLNQMTGAVQKGAAVAATGSVLVATAKQGDSFDGTHTPVHSWQEGSPLYPGGGALAYLHMDDSPSVWEKCPLDPTSAGYALTKVSGAVDTVTNTATPAATACSYLTATDSEGQTVSLYGYKLLSAYPNHSWSSGPESWGTSNHSHDVARWCGRCHNQAVDSAIDATSTFHSHPTGCTACHGNPNSMTSFDFPHTSTMAMLLKDYPDALCINCHTSGNLP